MGGFLVINYARHCRDFWINECDELLTVIVRLETGIMVQRYRKSVHVC